MSEAGWAGRTLLGRYQIKKLLGRGGMAEVYEGYDPNLSRTVAIKLIHPHLATEAGFLGRFEREAQAIARLRHASIVQVYDFNHEGDVYFMVMEYVDGPTLQGRLRALAEKGERLPLGEVVDIMTKLADAIHYAHTIGMVHRDLKPSNILFTNRGEPVITDFGLARILGGASYTATGAVMGTPLYMAPEQGRGEGGNETSDIYSLGVILYEMATGSVPFEADTPLSVMMKHITDPVPSPLERNPNIPPLLADVITTALAKDPANRFKTAEAMSTALALVKTRLAAVRSMPPAARKPAVEATTFEPPAPPPGGTVLEPVQPSQPPPGGTVLEPPSMPPSAPPSAPPAAQPQPARPVTPQPQPPQPQPPAAVPAQMAVGSGAAPAAAPAAGGRQFGMIGIGAAALVVVLCLGSIVAAALFLPGLLPGAATQAATAPPTLTAAAPDVEPSATTEAAVEPTSPPAPTVEQPTAEVVATIAATLPPASPEGMVEIPAGEFIRGISGGTDNQPERTITLKRYFIDQTEVTNAQFAQFVSETGYVTFLESLGRTSNIWRLPQAGVSADSRPDHPVVFVVWDDAFAYCQWAGKRLPTEAEWEKAARGPDGNIYPWGNNFDGTRSNTALNPNAGTGTTPAGSFPEGASPFGVMDMSGNVWELINDLYSATYFGTSPDVDPPGPTEGVNHVTRGGGWRNNAELFVSAVFRDQATLDFGDDMSGFRCAQDAP